MIKKISEYMAVCKDDSEALFSAVRDLDDGDTLQLEGRTLNLFADEFPSVGYYYISNNESGDKRCAVFLKNKRNICIDGQGAELILHGAFMAFIVDNCQDVSITALRIDYADPLYVQAKITDSKAGYIELEFDDQVSLFMEKDGKVLIVSREGLWEKDFNHCLVNEFESDTNRPCPYNGSYITETDINADHGFLNFMFKKIHCELISKDKLALIGDVGQLHNVGNYWVATFHTDRKNPGIFCKDSSRIFMKMLTLNHALAMGIICQSCENVSLYGITVEPRRDSGRMLSICADATHFVNCRGKIEIKESSFVNMLDDAINIHGIYNPILQQVDGNTVILGFGHPMQSGVLSYRENDSIRFVDVNTGRSVGEYTVASAKLLPNGEISLTTVESIACCDIECVVEDVSATPEIYIAGCRSGNNRPRGFLLSSPKQTVVEDCVFSNMCSGISISSGMTDWYESGQVKNVTIRNNYFDNCSYASGDAVIHIVPEGPHPELLTGFHSGITITGNTFRMKDKRFLKAHGVEGLYFTNNHFVFDPGLPHHKELSETGIELKNCTDTVVEALTG